MRPKERGKRMAVGSRSARVLRNRAPSGVSLKVLELKEAARSEAGMTEVKETGGCWSRE